MSLFQSLLTENSEPPLPPSFQASAYLISGVSYGQTAARQTALEPSVAGADIPMSWSCYVRPHNIGTALQRVFGAFVPGGGGVQQYSLVVRSAIETGSVNQHWQFGIFNGANFIRCVSSTRALKGRWVHMVITYSGSEAASGFNMYLNAVNDTTALKDSGGTYVGAVNNASLRFQLSSDNNRYRGHIRDLAIWNDVLNQTEVNELFNNGTPIDVSTVSFYGSKIVAHWPLHTDLVCANNATYNVTNTSSVGFSTIPLSPYAEGLSIFNGLVGNTRYIAFPTAVKRLDSAVFWIRSGTGHVDNGYIVKGTFNYTNIKAAAPVTFTGDILNALPNDLRGLYVGEEGSITGFTSQYDDVALAFLSSGRYVSTDGLTGEAFGSYTSMQTPSAGQSINFFSKVIRGDNAGEYLAAFHEYTVAAQSIYIWRSLDNMATWTKDASPCFTGDSTKGYNEPCILGDGNGNYVMLVREQAGAQLSCSVSSDNAVTWTTPVDSTLAVGTAMADMCLNPAGQIVVAYGDRGEGYLKISNYNNFADIMANRADWNAGVAVWQTIDGSNNILGYPWIISNGWHFAVGVSSEQSSTRADHFVGYGFLGLI